MTLPTRLRHLKNRWVIASLPVAIFAAIGLLRYDQGKGQTVEGIEVNLSTDPSPATVGLTTLKSRVIPAEGFSITKVEFSYFEMPREYMVPQEGFVQNVETSRSNGGEYTASAHFTKPGRWKVAVIISQSANRNVVAWFTVDVKG